MNGAVTCAKGGVDVSQVTTLEGRPIKVRSPCPRLLVVTCAGRGVEAGVAFERLDDVARVGAANERQVKVMLEIVQLLCRVDDRVPRPEPQEELV